MRKLGLIGYPLGHSFSAGYFADKFKELKIDDCRYDNYPLENIDLFPSLLNQNTELIGLNVTIPYKEKIIPFLTELHPDAKGIGAVNTIRISRNGDKVYLKGFNTDSYGFEQSLLPALTSKHKKALILGTGGAAKAAEWILRKLGVEPVYVSRTPKNENILSYQDLSKDIIQAYTVIVNSSPLGMYPNIDNCPDIPYEYLGASHILFDLIYNPSKTLFLQKGEKQGAKIINGLRMLQLQADKAWEIWNS